jgi:glycosyltransferase involved in cell wall biosynthesis
MTSIIYLHQYFSTLETSGGSRSYELARRLVAAGHSVTLLTTSAFLGETWAETPGWHAHELEGIHLEVLHVPYSNKMPFIQRIRAFFHFAFAAAWHVRDFKADVVFATSTPLTIAIPGIAAKLWHRIPLVFEVRDLWPELPIAVGALRNPIAKAAACWLEWVAYHESTHVVALSPGMAAGVMRRGVPADKVTVIPNGCDVALFDIPVQRGDWVRKQLGLAPNQRLIIYTGTFGLINSVGYLVDVAAAMRKLDPEICFLLVGGGAEVDKVTAQAEKLGILNETLWIWPPIAKAQIPDLLAAATIATSVVIPLKELWNNSANKFFDALAAGRPIAINYEGWQADLVREYCVGIVLPPDDAAKAASLLFEYVSDLQRLERAAAAAHRLAYTQFSREQHFSQLAQVLLGSVRV